MGEFDGLFGTSETKPNPFMYSVTTGKVVSNWDDKHPGMVKVEIFLGEEGKNQTDWVRVAQPYAGNGFGSYFLPEVGDEVVLAFNLGDRDHPIVIGSLWNMVDAFPPETTTEENIIKRIRTKGGHELVFSEESGKEKLTLHTPANLTLEMDDENEVVNLKDGGGANLLTIDSKNGAITIKAEKKIVLDVGGKGITIDGQGKKIALTMDNINLEATAALKGKGQTVELKGTTTKVEGSGTVDVKSSGMLNLKGSMTKIN